MQVGDNLRIVERDELSNCAKRHVVDVPLFFGDIGSRGQRLIFWGRGERCDMPNGDDASLMHLPRLMTRWGSGLGLSLDFRPGN